MTCLRQYLQRIDIEKALSIQRHAAEHAIIKCAFHNVCIPCLRRDFQHSPRKKDKTDRRTCFRIRRVVRQIVGIGERLAQMGAADSARNVHLFLRDVVPESPARPIQRFIPCQPRHIRHAGI